MEGLEYCTDCKIKTEIVLDHTTGDTICTDCGAVLESCFIDEGREWRIFPTDDNHDGKNPNRVDFVRADDHLLIHNNLVTLIKTNGATKTDVLTVSKWHTLNKLNPDRVLNNGFETISNMADKLGLAETITVRAKEIFRDILESQKICKTRYLNATLGACLFIACRECKAARTLKEICTVAEGVSRKDLNRAVEQIKKQLDVNIGTMHASEIVRRVCYTLGMENKAVKAVQEAVEKSKDIDIRRNPMSVLAAIIYIISQLSYDEKKPLVRGLNIADISMAAEVAVGTIKKSYKDVYPHASRLIPNWYAKEDDIKKICCP